MRLGIKYDCYTGLDDETAIALMQENGFSATFLMSRSERLPREVRLLKEAGISVESLHAPYPPAEGGIDDLWDAGERGERALSDLILCVEECARCDSPTLVVHPTSTWRPNYPSELGLSRFARLFERARECGVSVALENIGHYAVLSYLLDTFREAAFCYDAGHEIGDALYLPRFSRRLGELHLHDNFHYGDHHLMPYDGIAQWERIAREIASSPYTGSLMLEVKRNFSCQYDALTPEEYYARAGRAAERLRDRILYYRNKFES